MPPDTSTPILSGLVRALGARRAALFVGDGSSGGWQLAGAFACEAAEPTPDEVRAQSAPLAPPEGAHCVARAPIYVKADGPEAGTRAPYLAVPLTGKDGRLLGAIAVEMTEPSAAQMELAAAIADVAAIAIQHAKGPGEYGEEARRSQALLDMFHQMSSSQALPQILSGVCRKTVEAFGVSCATVFERPPGGGGFIQIANDGKPPDVAERFVRYRQTPGRVPREADFAAGRTVVVRVADAATYERAWLETLRLHTAALLPLGSPDTQLGILAVGIDEAQEFTPGQLLGLEVVAHHATTAMIWARFLRNAETAVRFRAAVSSLAVELNAQTERAPALQILCARGRAIFRSAWSALLLPSGDRLAEIAADGEIEGVSTALSVPLAEARNPAVRSYTSGAVSFATAAAGEGRTDPGVQQSILAIPLVGSQGPAGVLLFRDLRDGQSMGPGIVGEARILGALAAAVLRNLELLARLHKANADLRRANVLKDQLLANASHDLRTPLNVIIGYGQLAMEGTFGEPPAELGQVIERMVASACEQLTLVEDLLNLSRIELNILTLKPVRIPVAPLFKELEFMASSLVKGRPVQTVAQPVDPALTVQADPDRLRQILHNLISNAAKFTDEGVIEMHAAADGARVLLAVRDTGIGIAPENQNSIFEPFSQADEERASSGAGLGLAIARRLAHMMNGTLTVESQLGKGSTFVLALPPGSAQSESEPKGSQATDRASDRSAATG